ncbi:MAG TPA: amidohydrolase family protein [Gemmatimonadales bacterium]|jgi:imidazolonepropionase-like amidohydrolase|nr:amidohydrolase family protein [Gemmatimonadales bacterium]
MNRMIRIAGLTAALVMLAGVAAAQTVAITGARVLVGNGTTLDGATVVIRDGRIAAVGRDAAVPDGARVIDARGKVVTPGLLNSATSLGAMEIEAVDETNDAASNNPKITAAFDIRYSLNPWTTLIPIERDGGVTSAVVAPNPRASIIAGTGALIRLSGLRVDSLVERSPVAMFGAFDERAAARTGGSRGDAMLTFRELLQDVKTYAADRQAYDNRARRDLALSRLDLEAMVPVVEGKLPLALSVNRAADILNALALAREFRLRLIIIGAAEGWMVADDIRAAGVPVILDPLLDIPGYDGLAATLENATRLRKAGVTIAFATFDAHNARNLRFSAGNAVANGLPYDEALAAITSAPARIWGVGDRLGQIAAGQDADVVVWSGDPFELMTRAEHVFIRGQEMAPDNRQRELLARYRTLSDTLPPQYR